MTKFRFIRSAPVGAHGLCGVLCVLCAFVVAPLVFATTLTQWTQTTFVLDQGTYANARPFNNGSDVC